MFIKQVPGINRLSMSVDSNPAPVFIAKIAACNQQQAQNMDAYMVIEITAHTFKTDKMFKIPDTR